MDAKCDEHSLRADAVLYYGQNQRVWMAWELEGVPASSATRILCSSPRFLRTQYIGYNWQRFEKGILSVQGGKWVKG